MYSSVAEYTPDSSMRLVYLQPPPLPRCAFLVRGVCVAGWGASLFAAMQQQSTASHDEKHG